MFRMLALYKPISLFTMRAKSSKTNGYVIYAISGTNTISFGIDFREADINGLVGFSVERINLTNGERKFLDGYKVFKELIPNPTPDTVVNTYGHPVQSFVWDDFTCYDNISYEYLFYPVKGVPGALDRSLPPIVVKISTEELFSTQEHDVFFNRGVASSQAYRRKFFNLIPDKKHMTDPDMLTQALDWLSRDLDNAILRFIEQAKPGDTLLGCFYEFHYAPIVEAFQKALARGVKVKLIVDAKENSSTDKKGKFHESFPRVKNIEAMQEADIDVSAAAGVVTLRQSNSNDIAHNKFIIWLDKNGIARQVWTGSTNISNGGIHGQTNVGHWLRNKDIAAKYQAYWNVLQKDPGKVDGDTIPVGKAKNKAFKNEVENIQGDITFYSKADIPTGVTPIFSPRNGLTMLDTYVKLFDSANELSCVTLAFGVNKKFKEEVIDNTNASHLSFLLLEKEDKEKFDKNGNPAGKDPFVFVGAVNNVYKAWGAYMEDNLYQWAKEVSTKDLDLNTHVQYVHSKFLIVDPFSTDPIVVTGSANFSDPSTNANDENMIIVRGNQRVADIYFTEFNRLFNHYYFRAVYKKVNSKKKPDSTTTAPPSQDIFISTDGKWLDKYQPGKLRYKKIEAYATMAGF